MRQNLLALFFLLLTASLVRGQECTEIATGFGNNNFITSYNISGDVEVVYDAAIGMVTLNLGSNYSTAFGPDVRAYLVKSNGMTDAELTRARIRNLENVQFGLTRPSGAQTYTIESPPDIEEFDKVFFYCLAFDQFWDFGTITPFSAEGCVVSSTSQRISGDAIELYPNPAANTLNVSLKNQAPTNGNVAIYNVIGERLMQFDGDINQTIDVTPLDSGVYTLQINYDDKITTKKLVVQK